MITPETESKAIGWDPCLLPFLKAANSMAGAVRGCAVVVSAVTAGECRAAAAEAAEALTRGTFYLDLNSVSPRTKSSARSAWP